MGTYPTSPRSAFLAWCQGHTEIFLSNATALGLTTPQATEFKALTNNAAAAQADLEAKLTAYRTAVAVANDAFDALRADAGNTVRAIRSFASNSANPIAVYDLAQIPPPAAPTPAPPPGQPRDVTVRIDSTDGSIILDWKCTNPVGTSGTTYVVRRRLLNTDPWTVIGITGDKTFIDDAFIAGPDSVQYSIFAQRAALTGAPSAILTVNFGRPAGGGLTIVSAQREAA